MTIEQFPKDIAVKTMDTSEVVNCGGFSPTNHGELKYITLRTFIQGHASLGGSETLTMKLYPDENYNSSSVIDTSAALSLSDITFSGGNADYLGNLRFDFNEVNINKNMDYFLTVEASNYTRALNSFYLSFLYNFPESPHAGSDDDLWYNNILKFEIFLKRERTL